MYSAKHLLSVTSPFIAHKMGPDTAVACAEWYGYVAGATSTSCSCSHHIGMQEPDVLINPSDHR